MDGLFKENVAALECGKTCEWVKIENWDSGSSDIYKLRLWMDWNGNYGEE